MLWKVSCLRFEWKHRGLGCLWPENALGGLNRAGASKPPGKREGTGGGYSHTVNPVKDGLAHAAPLWRGLGPVA